MSEGVKHSAKSCVGERLLRATDTSLLARASHVIIITIIILDSGCNLDAGLAQLYTGCQCTV